MGDSPLQLKTATGGNPLDPVQLRRLRRTALLMEATHDGVVVTDTRGTIVAVNDQYCLITGYDRDELIGKNPRLLQSGRHSPAFYTAMWQSLAQTGSWKGEVWNRAADGRVFPVHISMAAVRSPEGEPEAYVGCLQDVSGLHNTRAALDRVTHYDPLTGLPNRSLFRDRLQQLLESRADGLGVGVLLLNLSRFRRINEGLGHTVGDDLLAAVGQRLRHRLAAVDTVARLSADEYGILVADTRSPAALDLLAQRVLSWLRAPFNLHGRSMHLEAAIGIAIAPQDGDELAPLIRAADLALQRARVGPDGPVCFATATAGAAAFEHLILEQALREAIQSGQIRPHFQPQFRLRDQTIIGAEALARWHHPTMGLVSPGRFIPLAEEAGLIVDLDLAIWRAAATQWRQWIDAGLEPGRLAVNISPHHFAVPGLVPRLRAAIGEAGLPASRIEVEITEGALLSPLSDVGARLERLRALGVRVAIDDFGVERSNLVRLLSLPFDRLKLDRFFIEGADQDPRKVALLECLVDLTERLGLETMIEGVETVAELALAQDTGACCAQGFLLDRPLEPAVFEDRLTAQP